MVRPASCGRLTAPCGWCLPWGLGSAGGSAVLGAGLGGGGHEMAALDNGNNDAGDAGDAGDVGDAGDGGDAGDALDQSVTLKL